MDGSRIGDYLAELFHLGAESPVAGTGKRLIKHVFEIEDPHKEGTDLGIFLGEHIQRPPGLQ
jgi:hypothetical protein